MKNAWRIALSIGASLILAAAVWALPPKAAAHPGVTHTQDGPQLQAVSGKIQSVGSNFFTLQTAGGAPSSGQNIVREGGDSKTMTFLIDKNTTVEGELKVDANADVIYRQANGKNVAVNVRLAP